VRRALAAALLLAGCGKEPTVVPVRNLERPSDMSFVCMHLVNGKLTGRPMAECHPHLENEIVSGGETADVTNRVLGTFGLVTNTARGELAVVDMDQGRLVDLDHSQPGYNMVPVGTFPDVMSASQDGCLAATANRGSCDLAVIDPQRLLAPTFGVMAAPSTGAGPIVTRVVPTTPSGRKLQVAPQEIAFLPQLVATLDKRYAAGEDNRGTRLCESGGAFDNTHPDQRKPWRAVVTFPSCDLVAVVELPSGTIVSSVYVRPNGVVDAGTEPFCPTDCGAGVVPAPGPDAAQPIPRLDAAPAPDGGPPSPDATISPDAPLALDAGLALDVSLAPDAAPVLPPDAAAPVPPPADAGPTPAPPSATHIGALAVRPEGNRLYVGGGSDSFVTAIDIMDGTLREVAGGRIPLHDSPGGVRRLRLSLDPHRYGGAPIDGHRQYIGQFLGRDFNEGKQYLYAFASDDSIRVLDVNPKNQPLGVECDLNVDPQLAGGNAFGCRALADDPSKPPLPRRPFARGPGLRIPGGSVDQPPPVPQDIAFASPRLFAPPDPALSGDFGFVIASDGGVYVLNVDSQGGSEALGPDNTWRNYNLTKLPNARGAPDVVVTPARVFSRPDVPLPVRVPLGFSEGARIERVDDPNLAVTPKWATFPDSAVASPQLWSVDWEGVLTTSDRARGSVQARGGDLAGAVLDQGQEFCQAGVLPRDVVLLGGCSLDTDCSADGTSICRQAVPGTPGLCFPTAEARNTDLLALCGRLLGSRRRYEVVTARPQQLELRLKPDELPRTSLDTCQMDSDCQQRPPFDKTFSCLQLREGEPKRCVKTCGTMGADGQAGKDDRQCRAGTVCEQIPGTLTGPLCVEGPPILRECWPLGAAYEVQAGQSFLVTGGVAPRPRTVRQQQDAQGDAVCAFDSTRNPLLVNRIPLDAPHCENVKDYDGDFVPDTNPAVPKNNTWLAVQNNVRPAGPSGTWGNPCLFWGVNDDDSCSRRAHADGNRTPNDCDCKLLTDGTRRGCHVKALFQNPELRMVVTNLEQFAGDANTSTFGVTGGFRPDVAGLRDDLIVTMGVRLVTGPLATPESRSFMGQPQLNNRTGFAAYIYLLDQGRTSSSGAGRGQILRLNPLYGTLGAAQFDSNYSPYPFQIQ
jgi:hypothetical protein